MVIGSHGDVMSRHGRREMVACLVHVPFHYQCESMENLASHTFVLLNVRLCLHIQKRFFAYDNLQI